MAVCTFQQTALQTVIMALDLPFLNLKISDIALTTVYYFTIRLLLLHIETVFRL